MSTKVEAFELRLERTIRADRARVFEAWTSPEVMKRWFAPEGMAIPEVSVDLRVGGSWRVAMQEPEGGRQHIVVGKYRELSPPKRLVFTWSWVPTEGEDPHVEPGETVVTVELHEEGEGTRVVLLHEGFASGENRDRHGEGWTSCLDRLEKTSL